MSSELCDCSRGYYDPYEYRSCYYCFLDRAQDYLSCVYCGRWHSYEFAACYLCRKFHRDEAASSLRQYILMRDGYHCHECGCSEDLQIDHVKPCRRGGTAVPWNLQVLCGECNRAKGDAWWPSSRWAQRRRELLHCYFYDWRKLLDAEQRAALRREVDDLRRGLAA